MATLYHKVNGWQGFSLEFRDPGSGKERAWGKDAYGNTNVPAGLSGVVAIAAGYDHSLTREAEEEFNWPRIS